MTRLSAISVDLDGLAHYCRIQGLPDTLLDERARGVVGTVAIPRILELLAEVESPGTFFVITADLPEAGLREALRRSHAQGVELASHSHSHDYALSRWSAAEVMADLKRAHEALTELTGVAPVGFRAPGYTLSPAILEAVAALGYRYDSSTYPAVPYYLAKASVMSALAVLGRPSRAILDRPRVLLAPRTPYRPSLAEPYARGQAGFVELPMSVSPTLRFPFIGTFVTSLPWPLVERTLASLGGDALINFELHAIDFLDEADGIPPALARQQRDVRVPWVEKRRRLLHVFRALKQGRRAVTLADAALQHFT